MKTSTYILLIMISYSLSAQEKESKANDISKFQLGITFSPEVAFRHLYKVEDHPFAQDNIDYRNVNELPKLSYSAGFHTSCLMNQHFSLQIGVQYSNMGYKTDPLLFSNFDPRRGAIYMGEQYERISKFHFHYIEVPVQVKYRIGNGKCKGSFSLGLAPGYLVKNTRTIIEKFEDGEKFKNKLNISADIEKYSLTPFITSGVTYAINEQLTLQITSSFRFNTLTVFNEPISTNLWNAGLQLGCFYNL